MRENVKMPMLVKSEEVTPDEKPGEAEYLNFVKSLTLNKLHTVGLTTDETKRGVRRKLNKLSKQLGLSAAYRMKRETDATICVILVKTPEPIKAAS